MKVRSARLQPAAGGTDASAMVIWLSMNSSILPSFRVMLNINCRFRTGYQMVSSSNPLMVDLAALTVAGAGELVTGLITSEVSWRSL